MTTFADYQIFNLALAKLGETSHRISSITNDSSQWGLLASLIYPITRDEELRSYKWQFATKRKQITQATTTASAIWTASSSTMQVGTTANMLPGWLVTTQLLIGGGTVSYPPGIQTNTYIQAIVDGTHITMSLPATASGAGSLVFQVNNLTGYWYSYIAPDDILRGGDIYAVFPNYTFVWPYKVQNIVEFGFIYEAGYIYTNLDPSNGNPIIQYLHDPGVANYPSDFVEALALSLAIKLFPDPGIRKDGSVNLQVLEAQYDKAITRAQGNNNIEKSEDELGNPWWTERGR
jgi:hypothetical protein